jgi:hypothetical protein
MRGSLHESDVSAERTPHPSRCRFASAIHPLPQWGSPGLAESSLEQAIALEPKDGYIHALARVRSNAAEAAVLTWQERN